jgi:phosphohistidine phosphatase
MKTLLILRHAKSSWKDESIDDYDRPLNERGKKEAPRMGKLLLDEDLLPDLILSSDAKRCRRTIEKLCSASGYRGETLLCGELYLATPATHLRAISRLPEPAERVLLVGHNPGLEQLLELFIQRYEPLTTAALAYVRLPELNRWAEINADTRGELVKHWQPTELP